MRKTQLMIAHEMPCPERMEPICNESDLMWHNKPDGGLWTSTRVGPATSAWTIWRDDALPDFQKGARAWALDIKPKGVRLFVVDHPSKLDALPLRTLHEPRKVAPTRCIDFERLAQDFDGLRLVDPNIGWSLFRDWSVESTLWFRWCFRRVREDVRVCKDVPMRVTI